jgi:membrane protease YdiL (CAAX protease family)
VTSAVGESQCCDPPPAARQSAAQVHRKRKSRSRRIIAVIADVRTVGLAALLSFAVAAFTSVVWGALLVLNATTTPTLPWSAAVMAVVLVAYWLYLSGRGRPRSTQAQRAALLRARMVPARVLLTALVAGGLALVALAGLWIVLVEVTGNGGNPTEAMLNGYPPLFVGLGVAMGSLVSPLSEEASFRGYAQVVLERRYPAPVAIVISSLFFAAWHGPTQGFFWSKLLFFFAVGVVFGAIAYLTNSTLPAIPVHIAGDLLFFIAIWPQDAHRHLLRDGVDASFWLAAMQLAVFAVLSGFAFWTLARITRREMHALLD